MLIVVGTRKRPDGNLKAMFVLLDLWKKGIRDCFFDANLSEKQFERVSRKIAKHYNLLEATDPEEADEPEELVRLPKDTLVIEANAAVHLDKGVRIVAHEEASGGFAIDSMHGARAIHEIYIPKIGNWYVWLRVLFGRGDDSYWIGIDDAGAYPWDRDGGAGGNQNLSRTRRYDEMGALALAYRTRKRSKQQQQAREQSSLFPS